MNEFAYRGRGLDELRTLAGSVDVGRVSAMQDHFGAVAHHMDDVVGLLVGIRKDLPQWWGGQASEGMLAAFDRVVSHTQMTHEVASGAARVLKTCATVVGEQQGAIGQVPEVASPGSISDAPAALDSFAVSGGARAIGQTPRRQYASSQSQAAGIVEGIAAQFVETKAQLKGLVGQSNYRDAGFQPVAEGAASGVLGAATNRPVQSHPILSPLNTHSRPRVKPHLVETAPHHPIAASPSLWQRRSDPWMPHPDSSPRVAGSAGPEVPAMFEIGQPPDLSHDSLEREQALGTQPSEVDLHRIRPQGFSPGSAGPSVTEPYLNTDSAGKVRFSSTPSSPSAGVDSMHLHSSVLDGITETQRPDILSGATENTSRAEGYREGFTGSPAGTHGTQYREGFVGAQPGPHGSQTDERGRRPDYLMDRGSAWLSDQVLAPSDGLMTPDWAAAT